MHMLNQMGEINSFIKLTLKSPISQYHQRHRGFDFGQQLEFKFEQMCSFTLELLSCIAPTSAENCLDSVAEKILTGNI